VENEDVVAFLNENLRAPEETLGDIRAQFAAYELAISRLLKILDDEQIENLTTLVEEILDRSETAMRRAIDAAPDGSYRDQILIDGFEDPPRRSRSTRSVRATDCRTRRARSRPRTRSASSTRSSRAASATSRSRASCRRSGSRSSPTPRRSRAAWCARRACG
jgi:hypothetical protein